MFNVPSHPQDGHSTPTTTPIKKVLCSSPQSMDSSKEDIYISFSSDDHQVDAGRQVGNGE